jgi:hypothetical protein
MPHYKMVVAYSRWEFPLAGGPCALAKGGGGCLSNNIDSVSLLELTNNYRMVVKTKSHVHSTRGLYIILRTLWQYHAAFFVLFASSSRLIYLISARVRLSI